MNLRALIVEDDQNLATGIMRYLELHGIHCDYAANGDRALKLAKQNSYDVVVSDVNMPLMTGFEFAKALRELQINTPMILVTSRHEITDKEQGFAAGVDDYLVKPFDLKELLVRVKAISSRRTKTDNHISIKELDLHLDCGRRIAMRGDIRLELTNTNWLILESLCKAWPKLVDKASLEKLLWPDSEPDTNALKVQIYNLRQKVDKPFEKKIIQTIKGKGLVLSADL